jgi:hypothetical protein
VANSRNGAPESGQQLTALFELGFGFVGFVQDLLFHFAKARDGGQHGRAVLREGIAVNVYIRLNDGHELLLILQYSGQIGPMEAVIGLAILRFAQGPSAAALGGGAVDANGITADKTGAR